MMDIGPLHKSVSQALRSGGHLVDLRVWRGIGDYVTRAQVDAGDAKLTFAESAADNHDDIVIGGDFGQWPTLIAAAVAGRGATNASH